MACVGRGGGGCLVWEGRWAVPCVGGGGGMCLVWEGRWAVPCVGRGGGLCLVWEEGAFSKPEKRRWTALSGKGK